MPRKKKTLSLKKNDDLNQLYAIAVDKFFSGIKNKDELFSILSKEEERQLIEKYKDDRRELENQLITHNIFLAINFASKYQHLYKDYEELISAAMNGLCEAATKFDTNRGTRFNTCACWWILNHITKPIRLKGENELIRRTSLFLDEKVDLTGKGASSDYMFSTLMSKVEPIKEKSIIAKSPVEEIENNERETKIKSFADNLLKSIAASSLDETDKEIFNKSFLEHKTIETISKQLGITKNDVSRGKKRVLTYINTNFSLEDVLK